MAQYPNGHMRPMVALATPSDRADLNPSLTIPRHSAPMRTLILLMFLTACGAQPAPQFMGAKRTDVVRDGRSYTVYQTERSVEVIRLGYAKRGEHQAIRAQMIALIPEVTGCTLVEASLQGDSGEMRGRIRCRS